MEPPVMIYIEQNLYYDLKNKSEGFKRAYDELLVIKETNDKLYLEQGKILKSCQETVSILQRSVEKHKSNIKQLTEEKTDLEKRLELKESNKKWIMNLVIGIVIGIFITLIVNQFFG
jgi:ABC-type siderophore export system fused ATPase/permease subunit